MGRRGGDPEDWRLFVLLVQSFKFQNARQLSEASGVSPRMISRYQLAREVPSPETAALLELNALLGAEPRRRGEEEEEPAS